MAKNDQAELTDAFVCALDMARNLKTDRIGLVGYGVVHLLDGDGKTKQIVPFANLITDSGDLYYASQAIAGVSPAAASAPTLVTGMKLGTGTTAVAKNGTGSSLVTYLSGSNATFDTSYPQTDNLGAGSGVNAVYRCTYGSGTATSSAITEAVIVNDAATDATSSAANTISRTVFSAINKGATDVLTATWNHTYLGA